MDEGAFAPLTPDEESAAPAAAKAPTKVPIVPAPADAPPLNFKIPSIGGAPNATWRYPGVDGETLFYVGRWDYEQAGKPVKDVRPITFCQVGDKRAWRAKAPPAPRPLYGLDRLAARPEAPVVIVEGEKTAEAAATLLPSYVAVSWQGGGQAVHLADWTHLAGRDVTICPDRDRHLRHDGGEKAYDDQAGTITAAQIAARLKPIARSIILLRLDGLDVKDGWDLADGLNDGWDEVRALQFLADYAHGVGDADANVRLPYGYELSETGLYFVDEPKGEAPPTRVKVAGRFRVAAKTRSLNGGAWGVLLEWEDGDRRQHRWAMPASMLAGEGAAIREVLMDQGLYVATSAKGRGKLQEFLAAVDTDGRARAVDRVGWASDTAFALPEETIGDTGAERIIFQSAGQAPHPYHAAGTLADWKNRVAQLAIGNSRLAFAISGAFVGPIIGPCGEESGGVNFKGASSTGKTTALRMAASAWGSPRHFMNTWRATANGLEGVATQHSETLLCLDEMSQISDPREAGAVAYMLANEQGKVRANRLGAARASAQWRVNFLSTGEVSLSDVMTDPSGRKRGANAGQEVRVLDIPADAGAGRGVFEALHGAASADLFSRQIKAAAMECYGVAGPAFVRAILPMRAELPAVISAKVTEFVSAIVGRQSDGQVHRAARRFGLFAAAGELAAELGILPWPEGEAREAAAKMFKAWVQQRGGIGSAEERNHVRMVKLFMEKHGSSRFAPMDDDHLEANQVKTVDRAGFVRRRPEGPLEYIVLREVFRQEICGGHDYGAVESTLIAKGIMRPDSEGKHTTKVRLPGIEGTTRHYVIGSEIFSAEA